MIGDNTIIETIANRVWDVISVTNGNPDYAFSSIRFALALFFLFMLYEIIRMRVIASYQTKHLVAMAGVVVMMFREATMLILMGGWEIGIFHDPIVHFLWPPIEHTFEGAAFLCFAYYSIERAHLYKMIYHMKRAKWAVISLYGAFCFYTMVAWKAFFTEHYPDILYSYKECMVDWQSHAVFSLISAVGFYAAFEKQARYLIIFWGFTLFEHFIRTLVFYNNYETSEMATIFHLIHVWSFPILILHFVDAYVEKISNCGVCRRDILM